MDGVFPTPQNVVPLHFKYREVILKRIIAFGHAYVERKDYYKFLLSTQNTKTEEIYV